MYKGHGEMYDSDDGEGTQQQYVYNIYVVQTKRMTGKDSETGSWHTRYHKCGIINVQFFPWGF